MIDGSKLSNDETSRPAFGSAAPSWARHAAMTSAIASAASTSSLWPTAMVSTGRPDPHPGCGPRGDPLDPCRHDGATGGGSRSRRRPSQVLDRASAARAGSDGHGALPAIRGHAIVATLDLVALPAAL